MIILIPCKGLDQGKSRLSAALDVHARRALCEFFLCRTLAMARAMVAPDLVYVVSADPKVVEIADRYSVAVLTDSTFDLNCALEEARAAIAARHANLEGLLIMPIDLPLSSADSLSSVVAQPGDIVIVPDESETGTNVLFLRQTAAQTFQFRFGPNSYQAHCSLAKDADLALRTVRDGSLSLDVDFPEQLWRWLRYARV
ncbi:MAG TPA: 2-phospho-L-lactate guanylyltransferase [Bradyrhizobium sp.]|nr:2-phospho-L-lactate guanylyltransferase [Bradyrhizobium sp.]